jgi:DNA-binding transcriptional LysR family regulator
LPCASICRRIAFAAWGPNHAWRFSRDRKTASISVRGQLVCNNGQALLAAALSHFGVIVQADVLDPLLESGTLVRLLPDWALPTRAMYLVRRSDVRPSAKVRSFVDFVKSALHREKNPG